MTLSLWLFRTIVAALPAAPADDRCTDMCTSPPAACHTLVPARRTLHGNHRATCRARRQRGYPASDLGNRRRLIRQPGGVVRLLRLFLHRAVLCGGVFPGGRPHHPAPE